MDEIELTQLALDIAQLSHIDAAGFCGIELGEFPACIVEIALWMVHHIRNNRLSLEFGECYTRIPLKKSPHILNADVLETDWCILPETGSSPSGR